MHKRNKGKNKHKNPNPTPPQQPKKAEEPKIEEEKVEIKEVERVPEMAPEVTVPTEVESETIQTPAKPKRNRGGKKRKQNEKDDFAEINIEQDQLKGEVALLKVNENLDNKSLADSTLIKTEEFTTTSTKSDNTAENIEIKSSQKEPDIIDTLEQLANEEENFAPVARKKKGKQNKNVSDPTKEKVQLTSKTAELTTINECVQQTVKEQSVFLETTKPIEPEPPVSNIKPELSGDIKCGKKKPKKIPKVENDPQTTTTTSSELDKKTGKIDTTVPQKTDEDISERLRDDPKIHPIDKKPPLSPQDKPIHIEFETEPLEKETLIFKVDDSSKDDKNLAAKKEIKVVEENVISKLDFVNVDSNVGQSKHEEPLDLKTCDPSGPVRDKKKSKKGSKQIPIPMFAEEKEFDEIKDKYSTDLGEELKFKNTEEPISEKDNTGIMKHVGDEQKKDTFLSNVMEKSDFKSSQHKTPFTETVAVPPDTDSKSVICDIPVMREEHLNTEFDNMLKDTSLIDKRLDDSTKQIHNLQSAVKSEIDKFLPLSECHIDDSCKKLFEALLVTEATTPSPTQVKDKIEMEVKNDTKKEEEFIIRLFEKSTPFEKPETASTTDLSLKEPTDLKGKVMEVNKDMEDLKLSIEKSLAELTAMEADDMPELIAITDLATPPNEPKLEEAGRAFNVDDPILQDTDKDANKNIFSKILCETLNTKIQSEHLSQDDVEAKENVNEPHSKKNKGKGKSTKAKEQKQDLTETEMSCQHITDDSLTFKETDSDSNINFTCPNIEMSTQNPICIQMPKCEHQSSSPEPKGKGKGKNKKKNKSDLPVQQALNVQLSSSEQTAETQAQESSTERKTSDESKTDTSSSENAKKSEAKEERFDEKSDACSKSDKAKEMSSDVDFKKAENFEDALATSVDHSQMFESVFAEETSSQSPPIIIPIKDNLSFSESETKNEDETERKPPEEKQIENPLATRSKNLLGSPDFPVASSKNDYKREKNKKVEPPNAKQAEVAVKDCEDVANEKKKHSKQSQTENKMKSKRSGKSASPDSDDEEFVYKYSFRKVFLTNTCNNCNCDLKGNRVACGYCNLVFYCSQKHKDQDWPQHQALCFAVSTLVHLKGLKFIYEDAIGANGHDYRLIRMQAIVSCEKILKRKILPCEQEILLYPRICSERGCREWKTEQLADCEGCGLVSYCIEKPQHLPKEHQTWCKSYKLYYKLVTHQQTKGRVEPKLPSKGISDRDFRLPEKINELLAHLYEENIDMDDVHYAALTQLATAPLTSLYSYQLYLKSIDKTPNSESTQVRDKTFTIHVVGAELQFEADTLNKWEVFFLHLRPDVDQLNVVFVGPELNPSKLPLDLLAKIKTCSQCRQDRRGITFDYQDRQLYHSYVCSENYIKPDMVCAFNPGLYRTTGFGGIDSWPDTINSILKQKIPFCVTSYTKYELPKDLMRIRECATHEYKTISEPSLNPYASIRPDRNFISDDEMPLIFKNYYFTVLCGV